MLSHIQQAAEQHRQVSVVLACMLESVRVHSFMTGH